MVPPQTRFLGWFPTGSNPDESEAERREECCNQLRRPSSESLVRAWPLCSRHVAGLYTYHLQRYGTIEPIVYIMSLLYQLAVWSSVGMIRAD